jgi:hypothetical protein
MTAIEDAINRLKATFALTPPLARNTDPATSHAAAASAKELQSKHHLLIFNHLVKPYSFYRGQTIYEIAEGTGLDHNAVARRMSELERLTLAYPKGERKGASGRMCRVWWAQNEEL